MYPGVFDPRYAVNPSLEARLRIEHTGAPQITVGALGKCHYTLIPNIDFRADALYSVQKRV